MRHGVVGGRRWQNQIHAATPQLKEEWPDASAILTANPQPHWANISSIRVVGSSDFPGDCAPIRLSNKPVEDALNPLLIDLRFRRSHQFRQS